MEYNNFFYIYLGIIGGLFWVLDYFSMGKKPQVVIPESFLSDSVSIKRILFFLTGVASWVFLTIALMGPRTQLGYEKEKIEANDLYFVVDVSYSMKADDFKPSRLEVAKEKIKEFIKLRPTDRIGIIIFSEKAFTLLPLSTDLSLIDKIIEEIKIGFLGSGTNIGDALALAVARGSQSIAKNKVIILMTDGVSNVDTITPIQAAEEAAKKGLKVYTIGIGGNPNAKIPLGVNAFGKVQYQNIPGGSIDTKTLQTISDITGGKTYLARDPESLKKVFNDIEELEKIEIDTSGRIIYKEEYYFYLFIGAFLFILSEFGRRIIVREAI